MNNTTNELLTGNGCIDVKDIFELVDKKIMRLVVEGCNSGNLDWLNYEEVDGHMFDPNMCGAFLGKCLIFM